MHCWQTCNHRTFQPRFWEILISGLWQLDRSWSVRTSRLMPFGHRQSFIRLQIFSSLYTSTVTMGESLGSPEIVQLLQIAIWLYLLKIINLCNFWHIFSLGINPIDIPADVFNEIYSRLFSVSVFVTVKHWKQSKCPRIYWGLDKLWSLKQWDTRQWH